LKLNLGCGEQYADGWINVDHAGSPHRKDLEVDLTGELPWSNESVNLIYAGHLLEHLTLDQCHELLTKLRRCTVYGGELMIVGPDVNVAARLEADGHVLEVPLDQLRFGAGRWHGDVHRWECTHVGLVSLVVGAGWDNVRALNIEDVPSVWPVAFRGPRWQVAVYAEA
jgi:hypothetical protein